ncbi:cysteine desufuration protein SufE [Psychromonas sp. CNPT3]|uniref:SufE family protein n=1 Tax=Psychromonas sp. CNPT3 TaxID=314282 RepID=UPI00006E8AD6|nr:SufE family protein [Psychromonas sp. CNPT3]AGH80497.1 cysteine desufuration protein SufE [Psychromonas sp. CNPT3]
MNRQKLLKNFNRCYDWEEKYLYIIELGEKYAILPASDQIDKYAVIGCQSRVWVKISLADEKVILSVNSDAAIVRGLAAMLLLLLQGMTLREIRNFDIAQALLPFDLKAQITPTRDQGMQAMLKKIYKQLDSL